jgi:hypothetical protein
VSVAQALPFLEALPRVAAKPTQTGLGVGRQTLAVDLPTPQIASDKMIATTHLFGVTIARTQPKDTAQDKQGGQASFQGFHADISMGCSTESVQSVDSQGTDIAFLTQMATIGRSVGVSAEISGIVEFQPLLQDI